MNDCRVVPSAGQSFWQGTIRKFEQHNHHCARRKYLATRKKNTRTENRHRHRTQFKTEFSFIVHFWELSPCGTRSACFKMHWLWIHFIKWFKFKLRQLNVVCGKKITHGILKWGENICFVFTPANAFEFLFHALSWSRPKHAIKCIWDIYTSFRTNFKLKIVLACIILGCYVMSIYITTFDNFRQKSL